MKTINKTTMLEINRVWKDTEEDVFNEGCTPNSGISFDLDIKIKANTREELIAKLYKELGFDQTKGGIEINAIGDNPGRIDIQVMEDKDGCEASESDMADWKKGKKRLWLGNYVAYAELVTRETANLE